MRHPSFIAAALLTLACACSGSSASAPAATLAPEFVGSWARSGTLTVTCPGASPVVTTTANDLVLALGTASDTLVATTPDGCMTNLTVSGSVATEVPGQSCSTTTDAGVPEVITQTTHTLTLSADEKSLTEAASGQLVKTVGGKTTTCSETSSGTFTKQ